MSDSTFTLDRVLSAFEHRASGAEPLTAPEVAEKLGCVRRTAYAKLQALVERGDLATKKVGARARIWWRPRFDTDTATLEEPEVVLERVTDAFYAVDDEWRMTYVNEEAQRLLGAPRSELLGRPLWEVFPADIGGSGHRWFLKAMRTQETVSYETYNDTFEFWMEVQLFPSETGLSVYFQDISKRKRREQDLERYETIVETIDDGVYVLDADRRFQLINDALASMLGRGTEDLLGSHLELVSTEQTLSVSEEMRKEMLAGERERARIETELHADDDGPIPVETRFRPLPSDGEFRGTVGVVRDVSERRERERQLRRQRDELETLHRITELVHEVIGGTIEAGTRPAVEQLVCDRLVESPFYQFAFIGRPNEQGNGYDDLTTAGLSDAALDYLRDHDFSEASAESATAAYFDGEVRVVERLQDKPELTPTVRRRARENGVRSAVGAPISYQETTYGVLVVGSSRPDAFGDREQTALELLGHVLGHTFDALETKQSLYADRTTELTFKSETPVAFFSETSAELSCRLTHQSLVPVADDDLVQYVTLDGASPDDVKACARDSSHISSCRTVSSDGDQHLLEFRTSTSGVAPLFDAGCRIIRSVAENGRATIVAEVASSADVQGIVDRVTTQLPGMEVVAKRTDATPVQSPEQVIRRFPITDELTDKQAAALRAAYFAGYYNWPRNSTAEEVADALGIAPSTFHQHLRKAQSRLTATYLDAD